VISLGRRFPQADSCWLEVFGTDGYERVEFMWGAEGDQVFRAAIAAQLEAFAGAVRGGDPVGATGQDAIAALTAAELAAEALADGRPRDLAGAAPALR